MHYPESPKVTVCPMPYALVSQYAYPPLSLRDVIYECSKQSKKPVSNNLF